MQIRNQGGCSGTASEVHPQVPLSEFRPLPHHAAQCNVMRCYLSADHNWCLRLHLTEGRQGLCRAVNALRHGAVEPTEQRLTLTIVSSV
jgi:hypothetical protein